MLPSRSILFPMFWRRLGKALSSVLLLFLAFPPLGLWWLLPFALIGWFNALKGAGLKTASLISYIAGFFFFLSVCWWLGVVTVGGLVVASAVAAFFYLFFGALFSLLERQKKVPLFVAAAAAWCLVEFLRSKLSWLAFPWALVGHPLYEQTALVQAADLFGIWGYSFLLPLLNFGIAEVLLSVAKRERPKVAHIATVAALLLFFPLYGLLRSVETKPSLRVLVVQGNIPQRLKEEAAGEVKSTAQRFASLTERMLSSHIILTEKGLEEAEDVDLVVWPETMVPGSLFEHPNRYIRIVGLVRRTGVPLFLGTERRDGDSRYNSAALVMPDGTIPTVYDKIVLVPVGEFIPARRILPLFAYIIKNMIPYETEDLTPGEKMTVFELNGHRFVCLICFELSFSELVREAVHKGAEILLNISNDAWFERSTELELAVAQGVFRAVETRRAVVRVVNAGISCYISPKGVVEYLEVNGERKQVEGVLLASVETTDEKTLFLVAGDWIVYLCIILVGFSFFFCFMEKRQLERNGSGSCSGGGENEDA